MFFNIAARREHPLQFLLKFATSMGEPVQLRRGGRLSNPQRWQRRLRRFATALLGERALHRLGDRPLRDAKFAGHPFSLGLGSTPAGVKQERLSAPNVFSQAPVATRLTRLLCQRLKLGLNRRNYVVEP